jgi:hypothetical protein
MLKKTELYIEEKQVDLFGDEAFLLNFNVADITDISAKASSYSKELDIPATKINNQIFSHLFDVNSEGYFNPISKKRTELYIDGVCVMRGYFKLNSMTIIDNEYVTYHGVIFEDGVNFIGALGDLELSNLVMPLTSNTGQPTGVTQSISFTGYTGTDFQFQPPVGGPNPIPAKRLYNLNFTGGSIPSNIFGAYGTFQDIPKGSSAPWLGINHNPSTIKAFVAAQDCILTLQPIIYMTGPSRSIRRGFVKAVQNSSGTWVHTPLTPPGLVSSSISGTQAPAPTTVELNIGEALYYYFADSSGVNFAGSTPPPPIQLSSTSLTNISGTITLSLPQSNNNLLINETYIINNISTAVNSDNSDICFPLIDYNQSYPYEAKTLTDDQTERPAVRVRFEDMRPAVFVKRVWDEIFKQSGFKYKSKFLDTNADLFKKLIVIGGMDEDEVESLQFERILTGTTSGTTYYELIEPVQDNDVPSSGAITGYEYNAFLLGGNVPSTGTTTSYWNPTVTRGPYVEFLKKVFTYNQATNAAHGYSGADYGYLLKALVTGKYKVQAQINMTSMPVQYGTGGASAPLSKQGLRYTVVIERIKGGSYNNDPSLFTKPSKEQWADGKIKTYTFLRAQNVDPQDHVFYIDEVIELKRGDIVRVKLLASAEAQFDPSGTDATPYKSVTRLNISSTTPTYVRYYRLGTWVGYEATSITNMLPRGMQQSEFILGIAKLFNLYFEPDKQDPKTLWVEPRDVYYEDGRVLNWEKKLDYSKPLDITILSHDQSKNYEFRYMDDSSDYYTEQFKKFNTNNLTFGGYKFTSPNEYTTETQDLEVPFASSYLQRINGTEPFAQTLGTTAAPMVITKIIDPDSQKPEYDGDASSWEKEPRILYYGGKTNLPAESDRNYDFYMIGTEIDGDEVSIELQWYAYAGHFDKPLEPTIDINFFTDTHYLPTTYWNNIVGNTTSCTSTTTVDLAQLIIGQNVSLNKSVPAYFNLSTSVNKYVTVYKRNVDGSIDTSNYFIGVVVSNTTTSVTLKVVFKYYPTNALGVPTGTTSFSSWKLQLTDVTMKYNLFNTFYKNQMIELTDQSARLMTCSMYLTPTDIANFRFNDVIYAHKEYWRVNKIIDYDTSSDINQTTKVELIKILRADTSALIDYIQGGYLGIAGGTGGGVSTGGGSTGGVTPAVVGMAPNGNLGNFTNATQELLGLRSNSITLDAQGLAPRFFEKEATVETGINDLRYELAAQELRIDLALSQSEIKPIGESITYTDENAGNQTLDGRYSQVYFDVTARNILFIITLQDVAAVDGFTVHFDALNATTTTFMQIENGNATTNEIFVINEDNSVVAKYDGTKELWVISKA